MLTDTRPYGRTDGWTDGRTDLFSWTHLENGTLCVIQVYIYINYINFLSVSANCTPFLRSHLTQSVTIFLLFTFGCLLESWCSFIFLLLLLFYSSPYFSICTLQPCQCFRFLIFFCFSPDILLRFVLFSYSFSWLPFLSTQNFAFIPIFHQLLFSYFSCPSFFILLSKMVKWGPHTVRGKEKEWRRERDKKRKVGILGCFCKRM